MHVKFDKKWQDMIFFSFRETPRENFGQGVKSWGKVCVGKNIRKVNFDRAFHENERYK